MEKVFPPPSSLTSHPRDGVVDRLERLESLGHEEVGELLVHRLHATRHLQDPIITLLFMCSHYQMEIQIGFLHLQDPLLVGVGRVVVGRGAASRERMRPH